MSLNYTHLIKLVQYFRKMKNHANKKTLIVILLKKLMKHILKVIESSFNLFPNSLYYMTNCVRTCNIQHWGWSNHQCLPALQNSATPLQTALQKINEVSYTCLHYFTKWTLHGFSANFRFPNTYLSQELTYCKPFILFGTSLFRLVEI